MQRADRGLILLQRSRHPITGQLHSCGLRVPSPAENGGSDQPVCDSSSMSFRYACWVSERRRQWPLKYLRRPTRRTGSHTFRVCASRFLPALSRVPHSAPRLSPQPFAGYQDSSSVNSIVASFRGMSRLLLSELDRRLLLWLAGPTSHELATSRMALSCRSPAGCIEGLEA